MQVYKINNYSQNSYSPKFTSIYRDVYAGKNIKHRNVSWMFRPSLYECKNFYRYISDTFKDVKKVNVYNYACSLGYEAYSFILGMFSCREIHPEKFFPIVAKDYDEIIIENAEKHLIPLDDNEINQIGKILDKKYPISDFLDLFNKNSSYESYLDKLVAEGSTLGAAEKKLTDNVRFSVADLRTDYKNIEHHNSIVLATNFWPYMLDEDRYSLAKNLSEQMEQNSYIKIDTFDNGPHLGKTFVSTAELLLQNGFKPTPVLNLFKK